MNDNIEIEVNAILRTNRNILKRNHAKGKMKLHLDELRKEGFVFTDRTNNLRHQDTEELIAFSFEYGVAKLRGDYFEIIRLPVIVGSSGPSVPNP